MVRVNVLGTLYMAHAALPHLLKAAAGGPRYVADLVNVSSRLGRVASANFGVYNLTKFGEVAFSESLRQEVTKRHVRVAAVEPGIVATEIRSHMREEARQQVLQPFTGIELLAAEDIADAIGYIVTRPRRVAVNELLIRPIEQEA
jgi:NADP-dependent 3-hydroxy acid dehydrogenase YdfG